ncbi:hypothetical protein FUT69_06745 [Xylella taiwanensis]|uniref:Uncharacterized protein n=1 Tax=Xylella taiwanensis TaxID=1444770 RepID=Z9JH48_9GAMM|nr:hypothetical protein [Xylella taiwanensis]EWS77740.1 hypothetical protein AF72_09310 [Xylella taiwanensis]MCD8457391.1 hypothetical protein [Xylella taiwanensis]MCD8457549.1 hypothetical protein [Xylella taiwanensis]MCD8461327.1 hypothetical protein [Xylella taiwanensis]MCD8462640.1 hypothetical protein [Xylella taiwanensis]
MTLGNGCVDGVAHVCQRALACPGACVDAERSTLHYQHGEQRWGDTGVVPAQVNRQEGKEWHRVIDDIWQG